MRGLRKKLALPRVQLVASRQQQYRKQPKQGYATDGNILVFKVCCAPGEKLLCVWKVPLFLIGLIVLSFSIALPLSA